MRYAIRHQANGQENQVAEAETLHDALCQILEAPPTDDCIVIFDTETQQYVEVDPALLLRLTKNRIKLEYEELPENPILLRKGCLLLSSEARLPGGESAVEFLQDLGGDVDTYIGIMGIQKDIVYGLPLGKVPFVPNFKPSWSLEQLVNEVQLGLWRVVQPGNPEFADEVTKRSVAHASMNGQHPK